MKLHKFIDDTIDKLNIINAYLCYESFYGSFCEKFIFGQCKSELEILMVDTLSYEEFMSRFNKICEQDLIICVFPFHVKEADGESMHNYLMELEKKGIYFINISAGIEGVDISKRTQDIYNKLLFQVIENSESKIIDEKSKYYLERLVPGRKIRISDDVGTNIEFIIEKVLEDITPMRPDRRVIQIPYGEVFVIPKLGSVNGKFVYKQKDNISVYNIENDYMILNNSFLKGRYPVCEVGFGTNDIIPNINYLPYLEKNLIHIIWE